MPRLHGWSQSSEDRSWTYGGQHFVAEMWGPHINDPVNPLGFSVRIWPRLGDVGTPDPTQPLGQDNGGMNFPTEAEARAYVESWERAK